LWKFQPTFTFFGSFLAEHVQTFSYYASERIFLLSLVTGIGEV
jgi:hypothetical protein